MGRLSRITIIPGILPQLALIIIITKVVFRSGSCPAGVFPFFLGWQAVKLFAGELIEFLYEDLSIIKRNRFDRQTAPLEMTWVITHDRLPLLLGYRVLA